MKEELKNESINMNNLLTEYVMFHNDYLKSAGTFRSLFRKVNFSLMAGNAYMLFEKARDEEQKIKEMESGLKDDLEREFFSSLYEYSTSIKETIYLLFLLLNALKEKAEGNELSFKGHMDNDKKYKESINKYSRIGEKLNKLYSKLILIP